MRGRGEVVGVIFRTPLRSRAAQRDAAAAPELNPGFSFSAFDKPYPNTLAKLIQTTTFARSVLRIAILVESRLVRGVGGDE